MITEDTTIKHLDIILDSMNVVGKFSVLDILTEKADFDWNKDDERSDFNQTKIEVERLGKMYGYLEPVNNRPGIFTLTKKGIEAKKKGGHLKYDEYISNNDFDKFNIKIDNLISGDNYRIQSSNSVLNSPIIQKTVHTIDNAPKTKSWIEILAWIVGIIAGFIAIYEFVIKKLIE